MPFQHSLDRTLNLVDTNAGTDSSSQRYRKERIQQGSGVHARGRSKDTSPM